MKKIYAFLIALLFIFSLSSCKNNKLEIKDIGIESESEFGGVYIQKTIDEFNDLGFAFGDSVDIKFSNGYKLLDQPYYNGYYVDANNSLLVGYPGYKYIKAAINYGDDLWVIAKLEDDMTCTITLRKKGKYKAIQEASDIHYYDERERYETDVEFANYRNIKMGNIKDNILYRSASPCNNEHNRASYVDTLMAEDKIEFIMNLADTKAKIDSYIEKSDFNSPYFLSLYQNEKFFLSFANDESIMPLALNMNYMSEDFAKKIGVGLTAMANSEGPYLVHCLEGKDRTGFVCIVLEALMSSSYQDIVDDYMLTYDNYYGIDINDSRYEIIKKRNVDSMLNFISDGNDYKNTDLSNYAKNYLKFGGMTEENINKLINRLK